MLPRQRYHRVVGFGSTLSTNPSFAILISLSTNTYVKVHVARRYLGLE